MGLEEKVFLGNIDAVRDWGHAKDFVDGMWRMLQQEIPGDYVLATGEQHSVREFVELSFAEIGTKIAWEGEGLEEKGIDEKTGKALIEIDSRYFRPTETDFLLGDPTKAYKILKWRHTTSFVQLIQEMVKYDIDLLEAKIN
jgi:GDPmannose 4,6-dehydratase